MQGDWYKYPVNIILPVYEKATDGKKNNMNISLLPLSDFIYDSRNRVLPNIIVDYKQYNEAYSKSHWSYI